MAIGTLITVAALSGLLTFGGFKSCSSIENIANDAPKFKTCDCVSNVKVESWEKDKGLNLFRIDEVGFKKYRMTYISEYLNYTRSSSWDIKYTDEDYVKVKCPEQLAFQGCGD